MTNKLFFKGLIAAALITVSSQFASAQDSTKKEVPVKPPVVYKPKAVTTQPAGTTYPAKPVTPQTSTPGTNVPPASTVAKPYVPSTPVEPNDRSINGQYQFLLNRTYGYQRPLLAAFYKSVTDTLNLQRKKVNPLTTTVAALKDSVKTLHTQLSSKEQVLTASSNKVDSISLLGIDMTKSAYNTLMWGLVIVCAAVAAFVVFRSGSYSREAKYRIRLYEDLDEEYKTYKAKANEKEKKLARELQTARNKLEELTGNPGY
ncbi:hypothetical protein [Mucilaginibacter jinjuensis]|uniref:Uncharacterized protein n=1 Tax=Mucilaginibacter jinjuensis TaxID=1176721 RepID=A0ABY7T9M1_9SPHI|nr:hypothetical protein [Mucilaginibacter jinjuensis]WCT13008.1 hypothetical protein PQO05_03550 [Mucilaginibacter jinjuensis]